MSYQSFHIAYTVCPFNHARCVTFTLMKVKRESLLIATGWKQDCSEADQETGRKW